MPNNDLFVDFYEVVIDGDDTIDSEITISGTQTYSVNSLTIGAGDQLTLRNGFTDSPVLTVTANSIDGEVRNQGSIVLDNTQFKSFTNTSDTALFLLGKTNISGGGTFSLQESILQFDDRFGQLPDAKQADHSINGSGQIRVLGGSFTNENDGLIEANTAGQTLELRALSSATIVNEGVLRASFGGTLSLDGTIQQNSGSTEAADGSTVELAATARITGGTISAAGSGRIVIESPFNEFQTPVLLSNLTLNALIEPESGRDLTISGEIENRQTVRISSADSRSLGNLYVQQEARLTGGGTIELAGGKAGFLQQSFAAGELTNVDNTIQGYGMLSSAFINGELGLVDANTRGRTFEIVGNAGSRPADSAYANAGTLRASDGGTLIINNFLTQFLDNTGVIEALDASSVEIRTGVMGGSLRTEGSGTINLSSSSLVDVSLDGQFTIGDGSETEMSGTIRNSGDIKLGDPSAPFREPRLFVSADLTLTGGGTVTLQDEDATISNENRFGSSGDAPVLLRNVDNTIRGFGTIGSETMQIVNETSGTIEAAAPGSLKLMLAKNGVPSINRGNLRAGVGGTLSLLGNYSEFPDFEITANVSNDGGVIESLDGGTVALNSVHITSGVLRTSETGRILVSKLSPDPGLRTASTIEDAAISGNFEIDLETTLQLKNVTIPDSESLKFSSLNPNPLIPSSNDRSVVRIDDGFNVDGRSLVIEGERLLLTDMPGASSPFVVSEGGVFGSGEIQFENRSLLNRTDGVIEANDGGTLQVFGGTETTTVANSGILRASNGGRLALKEGLLNNHDGQIVALDESTVSIALGSTIEGGTISSVGSGQIIFPDGRFGSPNLLGNAPPKLIDVTLDANVELGRSVEVHLEGDIVNRGSIAASEFGNRLNLSGDTTLAGGGTIQLGDPTATGTSSGGRLDRRSLLNVPGTDPSQVFTFDNVDNTIQGYGRLGTALKVINRSTGVIHANQNGQTLALVSGQGERVINRGVLRASNGGTILTADQYGQSGPDFTNNGIIDVQDLSLFTGPGALTNATDGTLRGTGTIDYETIINHGTIAPGNSPGNLMIVGDLVLDDTSVLEIEIADPDASLFDTLTVDGTLTLGGRLELDFVDTIETLTEDLFILSANQFLGGFDNVSFGQSMTTPMGVDFFVNRMARPDGRTYLVLSNTAAIPEPGSPALFGIAIVAGVARRQRLTR